MSSMPTGKTRIGEKIGETHLEYVIEFRNRISEYDYGGFRWKIGVRVGSGGYNFVAKARPRSKDLSGCQTLYCLAASDL